MTALAPLKRFINPDRPITYGIVQAGEDVADGVPYIRPVDMDGHRGVDPGTLRTTSQEIARAYKRSSLLPGDVVVSIGPSYGKTMTVPDDLGGANLTQGTARVAAAPSVSPRYLVWALQAATAVSFWDSAVGGATFRALNLGPLAETPIPVWTLDEQRRIADFLDAETAQIDTLIAEQERFVALLRERRSAAIAARFSELGGGRTELRRVASVQTGVTLSGSGDSSYPEWPYLRVANVQAGYVDLTHVTTLRLAPAEAKASMLQKGDVLMTEGGDIDKLGRGALWNGEIEPMIHQNHVFAVRPGPKLLPEYLVYWLDAPPARTHFFTTAKKTTNLASTNKTIVGRMPLVLPSIDVQREFVDFTAAKSQQTDALIAEAEHNIALSKERRAALITAAVTGQIDVSTARVA